MSNSEKEKEPRGRVFIVRERCKGCGFCIEFCPTRVLAFEEGYNDKGYHPPMVARPGACSGCNLCGLYCPDFAIHGVRLRPAQAQEADHATC
jgi:2-oxoglutarate ferredoxin oxidoreductase subunit delta